MTSATARSATRGPALLSFGFRPFFLLAALWAAIAVPLWIWSHLGGAPMAAHRDWHVHEMLFGVLGAIVAGFLTTAAPNWTGRAPVAGAPLMGLVALWIAGRAAMLFAFALGPLAAVVDSAFLVVLAAVIWREVLAGRNWRNLPVCGLLSLMAAANIAFHLDTARWASGVGERLMLAAAVVLIALIGGRIVPAFTRNWLKARDAALPAAFGRLDTLALALTGAAAAAWVVLPRSPATALLLAAAGAANLARLAGWRGWLTLSEPLVWILHLGYLWLGAGLVLLGGSILTPEIPRTAAVHALTVGAIGVMTLAVMTRASRGHTGRPLCADAATTVIYIAINLAALSRVAAPLAGAAQPGLLVASSVFWVAAYGGFAAAYGPMLVTRRRVIA